MPGKPGSSQQRDTEGQQQGNPLRLGEAHQVRAIAIATGKLEEETAQRVAGNVHCENEARSRVPQDHPRRTRRQAENPGRLYCLDRKQTYTGQLRRETHLGVGMGIPYSQEGGSPVTAAREETPDASPGVKQTCSGDRDIEIRKQGLMQTS